MPDPTWGKTDQSRPPPSIETVNKTSTPPPPSQGPTLPHETETSSPVSRAKEIATLQVRNTLFTNWTSVRVEQRVTEAFPIFQFECTEEADMPVRWDALQFVPGDICRVYIGGVPAVFGYITERHVAFDSRNHAVRLIGCGDTVDLTNSSVPLEQLSGHDGKSWTQLARDLAAHLNVSIHNRGAVDNTPFENIQIQPGETIIASIERYARMRNIVIGSEANGGLLGIGEHPATPKGNLVEGYNILRANCVVRDEKVYKKIFAVGQTTGSNKAYGDSQNKQVAFRPGSSTRNRYMVTVADIADTRHGVERRVEMEKVFTEGSKIEASITVQGWFKDNNTSDEVWRAGEYYTIESPMLILNGKTLGCAGCVYEQNTNGTTTTLQMVDPIHMNGRLNYRNEVMLARRIAEAQKQLPAKLPTDI